jgi:hypothetical protein
MLSVGYSSPQVAARFLAEDLNKELMEETMSAEQSQKFIKAKVHCQGREGLS